MNCSIAILGAPTSIGIRTYDRGEPRHLDRAPKVLRTLQALGFYPLAHSRLAELVISDDFQGMRVRFSRRNRPTGLRHFP